MSSRTAANRDGVGLRSVLSGRKPLLDDPAMSTAEFEWTAEDAARPMAPHQSGAAPQRNRFERHAADLAGFAGIIRRDCGIANSMFDPMLRKFGKIIGAFASMH
jgi:hypothetical protein